MGKIYLIVLATIAVLTTIIDILAFASKKNVK